MQAVWKLRDRFLPAPARREGAAASSRNPADASAAVDLASVADTDHQNQEHLVFDLVDDAVLTDPHSIAVLLTLELLHPHGPRSLCETVNGNPDPTAHRSLKLAEIPLSRGAQLDLIHTQPRPRSALAFSHGIEAPGS